MGVEVIQKYTYDGSEDSEPVSIDVEYVLFTDAEADKSAALAAKDAEIARLSQELADYKDDYFRVHNEKVERGETIRELKVDVEQYRAEMFRLNNERPALVEQVRDRLLTKIERLECPYEDGHQARAWGFALDRVRLTISKVDLSDLTFPPIAQEAKQ